MSHQKCVIGKYCSNHGLIHGGEAEELRQRIEAILHQVEIDEDDAAEAMVRALRLALDEVDARDSLAFLEAKAPVSVPPSKGEETTR